MKKKRMTTKEKLKLMEEIDERNEQRRREFVEQKKTREKKLLDTYIDGIISKEEFLKRIKVIWMTRWIEHIDHLTFRL